MIKDELDVHFYPCILIQFIQLLIKLFHDVNYQLVLTLMHLSLARD